MPRVKLSLPSDFIFTTEVCLRVSDINYGGHVGNDSVLSIIHEARVRFLRSYGWSELDVAGVGTIMTDAVIVYKSEAFLGDDIEIHVTVVDFDKYGCDVYYLLQHKASGREVARAKTGLAFFDYETRKLALIPQEFTQTFITKVD